MRFTGRLFVVVFVLSCGGFVINSNSKGQTKLLQTDLEAIQRDRITALKPRPVTIGEFQERIKNAKTYHDVLKLFFEAKVKNSELDDLIISNGQLHRYDIKLSDAPVEKREESSGQDEQEEMEDDDYDDDDDDEDDGDYPQLDALESNIQELHELGLNECSRPRPEIVHVVDEAGRHRVYYPDCTVVYRCRNVTGCCHNRTMECGPRRIQEISKTFLVMETIDDTREENLLGLSGLDVEQWMETKLFENHTECGCMEVRGLPGCDKRCPEPLTRRNPDHDCICDCPDRNSFDCVAIQFGIRALDQAGLRCIKLGECMPPKCDVGEFSLKIGYCPHRIENGRSIFYVHQRRRRKKKRFNLRG